MSETFRFRKVTFSGFSPDASRRVVTPAKLWPAAHCTTVTVVLPVTVPRVAVITVEPVAVPAVTRPLCETVATLGADELQLTDEVRLPVVPSL